MSNGWYVLFFHDPTTSYKCSMSWSSFSIGGKSPNLGHSRGRSWCFFRVASWRPSSTHFFNTFKQWSLVFSLHVADLEQSALINLDLCIGSRHHAVQPVPLFFGVKVNSPMCCVNLPRFKLGTTCLGATLEPLLPEELEDELLEDFFEDTFEDFRDGTGLGDGFLDTAGLGVFGALGFGGVGGSS